MITVGKVRLIISQVGHIFMRVGIFPGRCGRDYYLQRIGRVRARELLAHMGAGDEIQAEYIEADDVLLFSQPRG